MRPLILATTGGYNTNTGPGDYGPAQKPLTMSWRLFNIGIEIQQVKNWIIDLVNTVTRETHFASITNKEKIMENAICGAVLLVVAFVSYTRWQKEKESENVNQARIWMIVAVLAGAGGVVSILALLFG